MKPNFRALGPRFGKQHAAGGRGGRGARPGRAARRAASVRHQRRRQGARLGPDDVQLVLQPLEGYQLERAGNYAVALQLDLDDELRREGLAREVVHAIQNARKGAGLQVEDRIELTLGGDDALLEAVRPHEDYVAGETLATRSTRRRQAAGAERSRDRGSGLAASPSSRPSRLARARCRFRPSFHDVSRRRRS